MASFTTELHLSFGELVEEALDEARLYSYSEKSPIRLILDKICSGLTESDPDRAEAEMLIEALEKVKTAQALEKQAVEDSPKERN